MLYSIVFPILIVLSLVGIVMILMKKATALSLLKGKKNESEISKDNFLGKKVNGKFLLILEKTTRKLKLMFLKLENVFSVWGESIKQKRKIRENEGKFSNIITREIKVEEKENKKDKIFFQRKNKSKKDATNSLDDSKNDNKIEETLIEKKNEKIQAPLKKKDLFEKILIERIAANPKDIEAYERLGEYYFEIENWNYAKECFKQVIKLSPQNVNARMKMRKLGRILGE